MKSRGCGKVQENFDLKPLNRPTLWVVRVCIEHYETMFKHSKFIIETTKAVPQQKSEQTHFGGFVNTSNSSNYQNYIKIQVYLN